MHHYFKEKQKGFTLIEMLISLGVASVILSVIIFNQSKYLDGTALLNAADELGLTVSQAQSYGVAVKEFSPGSSNFSVSYGVTVSLLSGNSGSGSSYIFFADRNGNSAYDNDWTCAVDGSSECLVRTDLKQGNRVDEICVVRTSGADQCNSVAMRADVTFVRPNTEAQITFYNSGGQIYSPPNLKGVRIGLMSPSGSGRSVTVYKNGQVSVQ